MRKGCKAQAPNYSRFTPSPNSSHKPTLRQFSQMPNSASISSLSQGGLIAMLQHTRIAFQSPCSRMDALFASATSPARHPANIRSRGFRAVTTMAFCQQPSAFSRVAVTPFTALRLNAFTEPITTCIISNRLCARIGIITFNPIALPAPPAPPAYHSQSMEHGLVQHISLERGSPCPA